MTLNKQTKVSNNNGVQWWLNFSWLLLMNNWTIEIAQHNDNDNVVSVINVILILIITRLNLIANLNLDDDDRWINESMMNGDEERDGEWMRMMMIDWLITIHQISPSPRLYSDRYSHAHLQHTWLLNSGC